MTPSDKLDNMSN